jgi:hypothetical protein
MAWKSLLSVLLPVLGISAEERGDALESVAPLAAALSDGNATAFVQHLPQDAPNFAQLRDNARALIAQAEVTSSIEVLKQGEITQLDWYMEIKSRATGTIIEGRRGIVRIKHQGRRLRSIEPAEFFAPPKVVQ